MLYKLILPDATQLHLDLRRPIYAESLLSVGSAEQCRPVYAQVTKPFPKPKL